MVAMDVLSSRILVQPSDPARSRRFYRDTLGLAVHREFGPPENPGLVFFVGGGFLELSGRGAGGVSGAVSLWLQVRDVQREHDRLLAADVKILREPREEPWGLIEMWLQDPDGLRVALVQVPEDHPLRRDQR